MVTRVEASRQRYTHKIARWEHPIRVTADQLIVKEKKKTDALTGQLAADDSFVPLCTLSAHLTTYEKCPDQTLQRFEAFSDHFHQS